MDQSIPDKVLELIERFRLHRDNYHAGKYNETELRRDYLDPLFEAMGWDIDNKKGYAEAYREVVHEDAIRIGGTTKAPDYCFRIGGQRKFFVEAKKPAVNLKADPAPALQLRRYAWTAKLPLSIVTDFEEFAVYDCRKPPQASDKAHTGRIDYFTVDELEDKWSELVALFSPSAIQQGAFDKYATKKRTRGTAEVDDVFLDQLEAWRSDLAKHVLQQNKVANLTQRQLNQAVQLIIDRIVFLRICEDRGIEPAGALREASQASGVYGRLLALFRAADAKYNSGLFHFEQESGREAEPDTLTPGLVVGDRPLKAILQNLYPPESPYEFSVLPAEILGHVYERFLGSVIILSDTGKSVSVEQKPEVRKAGGVYYTPRYIVDYIVQHTVGELLKERKLEPKGRGKNKQPAMDKPLTVLDPACGSGSFLLGAFDHLLSWHLDYYVKKEKERGMWASLPKPPIALRPHKVTQGDQTCLEFSSGGAGDWKLTTGEKKRILIEHLYGVDIDAQAVEVTKLSLLLKVLEGESEETVQQSLFAKERALPDLSNNIKCGNSLIGTDFYTGQQVGMFSEDDLYRINAFDWSHEFATIMQRGGFNVVLGNPPYFNLDDSWGRDDPRSAYIKRAYPNVYRDKTDILFYFLARGTRLQQSRLMFIVSRAFLEAYKADRLRGYLTLHADIAAVTDFRNHYVFPGVGITTAIVKLAPNGTTNATVFRKLTDGKKKTDRQPDPSDDTNFEVVHVSQDQLGADPWLFGESTTQQLLDKLDQRGEPVGGLLLIGKGMETGRNRVFGTHSKATIQEWGLPDGMHYLRAHNSDIQRYRINDSGQQLLYVEDVENFDDLPAPVRAHLQAHEAELKKRAAYQREDCDWWRYTWPLHAEHHARPKLYCPYLAKTNRFALDANRRYLGLTDTTVLFDHDQSEALLYYLGLLNARALTFRFRYIGKLKSGGILEYFWNSVSRLPIRRIDFSDPDDVARHDRMVALVQAMLDLNRQLHGDGETGALSPGPKRRAIEGQIASTDRQIDQLVYELYGLTEEEIAVVEAATSP
ncbi:MAG: DNA methyltransferase [Planctomycetota bacterium]